MPSVPNVPSKRVVIDTNTLISAAIKPNSVPALALLKAKYEHIVCVSKATMQELQTVIYRSKFDRFFAANTNERASFLEVFSQAVVVVDVTHTVTACRDPKDNMFLELALSAKADYLVSGDKRDLLSMHPYNGVAILSAAAFLNV